MAGDLRAGRSDQGTRARLWIWTYCTSLRLFERAMAKAGVHPTRRSFVQAMATTGEFPYPTLGGVASFGGPSALGPLTWSGLNVGQRKVWQSPCSRQGDADNRCSVPVGSVYRMAA